jgi:hypothetical protein
MRRGMGRRRRVGSEWALGLEWDYISIALMVGVTTETRHEEEGPRSVTRERVSVFCTQSAAQEGPSHGGQGIQGPVSAPGSATDTEMGRDSGKQHEGNESQVRVWHGVEGARTGAGMRKVSLSMWPRRRREFGQDSSPACHIILQSVRPTPRFDGTSAPGWPSITLPYNVGL